MEKLKGLAGVALVLAIVAAGWALVALYLNGVVWAGRHLVPMLLSAGGMFFAVVVFILLPLSIFRGLRGFTGGAIFLGSYLFGLIAWLTSVVVTLDLWGAWAVAAGILLFGGMVVPFAVLASLFAGKWAMLGFVAICLGLTWSMRVGGLALAGSSERAARLG